MNLGGCKPSLHCRLCQVLMWPSCSLHLWDNQLVRIFLSGGSHAWGPALGPCWAGYRVPNPSCLTGTAESALHSTGTICNFCVFKKHSSSLGNFFYSFKVKYLGKMLYSNLRAKYNTSRWKQELENVPSHFNSFFFSLL